jgi:hypothetical protein
MATQAKKRAPREQAAQLVCPECGRTFTRAQALGAHRRQAHGVAGTSKNAKAQKAAAVSTATSRSGKLRSRTTSSAGSTATQSKRAGGAARSSGSGNGRRQTVDRDALLRTLFPTGIPPQQDVIFGVNSWLDEAERLARLG